MIVTTLYAALFGLGLIWLSWRVISLRREKLVSTGDGDDKTLRHRIRAHANYTEFVPLGLILLALVEWHWKLNWLTHALGIMLLVGRTLHALAFGGARMNFQYRTIGMVLTFASIVLSSLSLLIFVARGWL